jgi:hypothetical protein
MAIVKTTILDDDSNKIREVLEYTDPDDARAAWWQALLDRIDTLEKRVHKLESEAPRAVVSRADPTTYYSPNQPKSWR